MINKQLVRVIVEEWNSGKNIKDCELSIPRQHLNEFKKIIKTYPLIGGRWVVEEDDNCKLIQSNFVKASIYFHNKILNPKTLIEIL